MRACTCSAHFFVGEALEGQLAAAAADSGTGIAGRTWHAFSIKASLRTGLVTVLASRWTLHRTALAAQGRATRQTHRDDVCKGESVALEPPLAP
jgi:hypothetical protein